MSRPLPASLASAFGRTIENKGLLLHRARAVKLVHEDLDRLSARVRDGRKAHAVELCYGPGTVEGSCECTHWQENGPCRHLWAALLEADRLGHLRRQEPPITEFVDPFEMDDGPEPSGHLLDDDDPDADAELLDEDMLDDGPAPDAAPARPKPRDWREATRPQDEDLWRPAWATPGALGDAGLLWMIDLEASRQKGELILQAKVARTGTSGRPARTATLRVTRTTIAELPDAEDRLLFGALSGALSGLDYSVGYSASMELPTAWRISSDAQRFVIERLARAGRLLSDVPRPGHEPALVELQVEPPVRVVLEVVPQEDGFLVESRLHRGGEELSPQDLLLVVTGWAMLAPATLAPVSPPRAARWVASQEDRGPIHVKARDEAAALTTLLARDDVPDLRLPPEMGWQTCSPTPTLAFDIGPGAKARTFAGVLSFTYDGIAVADEGAAPSGGSARFVAPATRRIMVRDLPAESAARARLEELGLTQAPGQVLERHWQVPVKRMASAAAALLREGWRVTASGKTYRAPGTPRISVSSGIDWFEVGGGVSYGDYLVPLPEILRAARRGDDAVVLGDGTLGMLPAEWLKRHGRLLALGEVEDAHVRFRPTQAMLLDLLLEQQPEADCDATFARVRTRLRKFDGIAPARQPKGFVGTLRDYQLEGLAWLEFLRDFSFGGCLADDMGVGKTAQVLAMLETRRTSRAKEPRLPSLVVVPRSLIFNWLEEARRFTPRLRVVDLSRGDRDWARLEKADVGLITYGTLRRDAELLRDVELDYAILDEAQAIKNASSASAKAARLLDARHRLAITGTPVENHLGELWSLFEFLNPGMLGASSAFRGARKALELDEDTRETLSRALRPFLLRRTKAQVAKELPARTEQTLHCEMSDTQARHYRAVADRYRAQVLKLVDDEGLDKARMNVLEALLRLRQVACHPALVDRSRIGEKSGKLTTLLETLEQVLEEGHKALVFSQFTGFLEIVRKELDARGIVHEYLDGKTRDRQSRVRRFQEDPGCRAFLISLKAGGVGLNLTAADYVFLLDPWWNPAVEAQAIDRTHRIGQSQRVMAYRLVSTGTVEEGVLELQSRKRALADALLGEDASLLGRLSREDIELLLR